MNSSPAKPQAVIYFTCSRLSAHSPTHPLTHSPTHLFTHSFLLRYHTRVPDSREQLAARIADRSVTVGVIGLGYVGLPLLRAFFDTGIHVIGFDIDPAKIAMLRAGQTYLRHLGDRFVEAMAGSPRFAATDDFARLREPDAVVICVPTPLNEGHEPDLSFVERTTDDIAAALRPGQLIVLTSTTYPRTTREVVLPRLEAKGLRCGSDFFLAFAPEREDPGRKGSSTRTIPKLVGGIDAASGALAVELFRLAIERVIPVANAEIAEAAKLLENIYRAVNIALVNEMKVVLTAMGIDVWDVIAAASTKPFGFQPFSPGPGLGGHCIPIDPFYLSWKAKQVGQPTRFIELAGEVNHAMPAYVVRRTVAALAERGNAIHGARVLVLGLAYKPNIDDVRESPSFELIEQLRDLGARVDYNDPHVPRTARTRRHDLQMESVLLSPTMLASYDAILIATNHDAYDWQQIADHARLVVDTRNAMKDVKGRRGHIVSA